SLLADVREDAAQIAAGRIIRNEGGAIRVASKILQGQTRGETRLADAGEFVLLLFAHVGTKFSLEPGKQPEQLVVATAREVESKGNALFSVQAMLLEVAGSELLADQGSKSLDQGFDATRVRAIR